MKLDQALEIGKDLGLTTKEEIVNTIICHADMMFPYNKIEQELSELIEDSKRHGIQFCDKCGFAKLEGECYLCKKLTLVTEESDE